MCKSLTSEYKIFGEAELRALLPHRGFALMIDGARFDAEFPKEIIGRKRILATDPWLDGHLPGKPIYPGHCLMECCFLTALLLIRITMPEIQGTPMIARVGKTKFQFPALTGDDISFKLLLKATINGDKGDSVFYFDATIMNQRNDVVSKIYDIRGVNNTNI